MKAPKVRLYLRIRRSDGRDAFVEPAWNRNRTLRAAYGVVQGQPEHHPEGSYYVRYLCRGKRVWKSVGPDAALAAVRNLQHDLEAFGLGRPGCHPNLKVEPPGPEASARLSLAEATQAYLAEVRQFRSPKTIAACENMLGRFLARYPNKSILDITRKDLLDHMVGLRQETLGDRTVFNHIARITTLLKANGISRLLRPADMPRYDEKEVRAYNADELATLFAAASADERLLFHFFLGTGFRDGEVMHCT